MTDTLATICDHARQRVIEGRRQRPLRDLLAMATTTTPPRGFAAALHRARAERRFGLIAEIKRASPSRGLIRHDFDPPALARAYAEGGATCLSVLTEPLWFEGAPEHLAAARAAVDLPVLRKDFIVDPWQVAEARAMGADCILLILAALSDQQAAELEAAAIDLGMDVLAESHNGAELNRSLKLRTKLMGINNRDLKTLAVDTGTAIRLAAEVPNDCIVIAESGLRTHADLRAAASAGITSFLVGESLMAQPDVTAATRALLGQDG